MGNEKDFFMKMFAFSVIGTITLRLFLTGARTAYFEKCATTEGMGSGIPIKFARCSKSTKWVWSNSGETCPYLFCCYLIIKFGIELYLGGVKKNTGLQIIYGEKGYKL